MDDFFRLFTMISVILAWLLSTLVVIVTGQAAECYTCEQYLGSYCQCDRYEFYWNVDTKLYGLSNCKGLTQVPDFRPLCKTGDLWDINLSKVPLTVIPRDAFLGLYFLNTAQNPNFRPTVDLTATGFTHVAEGAFEAVYSNLESLILDNNGLTTIPEEFSKLTYLTHLSLKGNKLGDLPRQLSAKLENLEILDLSDNNMKNVPKSLCDFPKLDKVNLQFNPISGDLSDYVDILVKCVNLRSLLWPRTTMKCTCKSMKKYSAKYSPQFSIPAKYRLMRGSSYKDMDLLCDLQSSPAFVGRPVGDITVGEVWRTCYNETCPCIHGNKNILIRKTSNQGNVLHIGYCLIVSCLFLYVKSVRYT